MPLPSSSGLASLDFVYQGAPFVQVEAKAINTTSLDTAYQGAPFVAVGPIASSNLWVNVNGNWKIPSNIYVNVNGNWKSAISVGGNISNIWK